MSESELDFKKSKTKTKVLERGPLESVFPCSTSKVLDFLATFKDWDYSISDIAKNSGLSFKTTLGEIRNLEQQGVIVQTRTVGKATMYKLNLESKQTQHIDKLILEIAKKRAREAMKSTMETKPEKAVQSVMDEIKQAEFSLQQKKIRERG